MLMNKRNSLKIQSEAYDIVRHHLWKSAEQNSKKPDKIKTIEKKLVDLDNSLFFNYQMLHDIIQGKDAKFIKKIRPDGMVMLGYEAQALYFSLDWDDIHNLSTEIKEFEKALGEEKNDIITRLQDKIAQVKKMLDEGLINRYDADRYLRDMELPDYVTVDWLRDHVVTDEQMDSIARTKISRSWEKKHQIKGPKVLS